MDGIERWREAGEAGDPTGLVDALAPDVRLVSPITSQFVFVGDEVRELLRVAFGVIQDVRYTDEMRSSSGVALFYSARIGTVHVEEAQRLRLTADGRIGEITLFLRPLPALTRLARRLGPALVRGQGRPALARLLAVSTAPIDGMVQTGERFILPRAAPRSR